MDKRSLFFTSDWHLYHQNVLKFDNRPFRDLKEMHRMLINNYNSTVNENSICYFLGDVGFCSGELVKGVIDQLNGTKVLVMGNHDKNMFAMYEQGFDVVLNSAVLYLGKHRITMSHCPLPGIFREDVSGMKGAQQGEHWHGEHKNQKFMTFDQSDYHLHGHIHSRNKENGKPSRTDRQFDVGVPANNYRPVSWSTIEAWIAEQEKKK